MSQITSVTTAMKVNGLVLERESDFGGGETLWKGMYELKGKHVGDFAIGYNATRKRGYILQIEIDEELQGKGFGRIIVTKLEQFLKSKGAKTIVADAVRDNAIGFWRTLGYEDAGSGSQMFKPVWVR